MTDVILKESLRETSYITKIEKNIYCLTKIISLSAAIGKQFKMFEKHFPSPMSGEDFLGEVETASSLRFDVSLFSLESISTSRLSSDDCDVDSSDDSASAILSRSLLSQSYMYTRIEKLVMKFPKKIKKINDKC